MKYKELKKILKSDYDITDKEIDCLMYFKSLDEKIIDNIEVVELLRDTIILDFYKYFINNLEKCKRYIKNEITKDFIDGFKQSQQDGFDENICKNKDSDLYSLFLYAIGFELSEVF